MPTRKMTSQMQRDFIDLWNTGTRIKVIAYQLGVSVQSIGKWRVKLGLERRQTQYAKEHPHRLTVVLSEDVFALMQGIPNKTRYVRELIQRDLAATRLGCSTCSDTLTRLDLLHCGALPAAVSVGG